MLQADVFGDVERPRVNVIYCPEGSPLREDEKWNPLWTQFLMRRSYFRQVPIPTEVVIRGVGIQIPTFAREYFNTYLYLLDGVIMTGKEVVAAETGKFKGMYSYPAIEIHEEYEDRGDDGHVDCQLIGWKFVAAKKE